MYIRTQIISALCLIATSMLSARDNADCQAEVTAKMLNDTIEICVKAYPVETQLSFLMQGLNICILAPDTLKLSFPSAPMVKHKVRRHPNEVKAELSSRHRQPKGHDSLNHVVRPDVLPLVTALNDTTATLTFAGRTCPTRDFRIDVDRENAEMTFSIKVSSRYLTQKEDTVGIYVYSLPMGGNMQEFTGRRLSGELTPSPNGLGEGLNNENAASRKFQRNMTIKIN